MIQLMVTADVALGCVKLLILNSAWVPLVFHNFLGIVVFIANWGQFADVEFSICCEISFEFQVWDPAGKQGIATFSAFRRHILVISFFNKSD